MQENVSAYENTAQFWMDCIKISRLKETLDKVIYSYVYIVCHVLLITFFSFNHPQLVQFHDNLLKLNETQPELYS